MIDTAALYAVLRHAAFRKEILSYRELSARYLQSTSQDHHWHGTWDLPLGELNGHTSARGLPPISALVTYQVDEDDPDSGLVPPGNEFWNSPGVPPRPASAGDRELAWLALVSQVHSTAWPEHLPGLGDS